VWASFVSTIWTSQLFTRENNHEGISAATREPQEDPSDQSQQVSAKVENQLLDGIESVRREMQRVIRGKANVIDSVLIALLAEGSVLLEDVPGVGKTTLAKSIAALIDLEFQRVQCTPDLLPADILGSSIFQPALGTFEFRKGPIFCDLLIADEINRASPRTQSALLEAMGEGQVTIDGRRHDLQQPFIVIAQGLGIRLTVEFRVDRSPQIKTVDR
jgi:MoxR-like ATPase